MKSFKQRLATNKTAEENISSFRRMWTSNTLKGGHRANFELWKNQCLSEEEENSLSLQEQLDLYQRFLVKIGLIDEA